MFAALTLSSDGALSSNGVQSAVTRLWKHRGTCTKMPPTKDATIDILAFLCVCIRWKCVGL